jgi:hypothetical protein
MPRSPSKKSRVFSLQQRNPYASSEPPPARAAAPKPQPRGVLTFEVTDAECAYSVGALLDAQQKAQEQQARAEAAGDVSQAMVFGQKSRVLGDLAARIAKAFTSNSR